MGDEKAFAHPKALSEVARECLCAISITLEQFCVKDIDLSKYRLVAVESVSTGREPSLWRLTLKPCSLLPRSSNARIGAGGELFVQVDTARCAISSVTYGE
jgi:hypothetical protein